MTAAQLLALRDVAAGGAPRRRDVLGRLVAAGLVDVAVRYVAEAALDGEQLRPAGVDVALTDAGAAALAEVDEPPAWRAGRLF